MKINIDKKLFIESLSVGGVYAGINKVLPILNCVKIKVKKDCINIISSDGENAVSKKCDIISSEYEGVFCVDYKSIMQYVKLVSVDNIELIIYEDIKMLNIKHNKGSLELPIHSEDDFPTYKMDEDCIEVNIDSATINNWLVDAKSFVSDDILRPVMNGVYIYRRDGEIGCCGTDGHKMYYNFIEDSTQEVFGFIINKKSIPSICNICKSTDDLKIKIGKVNTYFIGDGFSVISRNTEGRFPNHKSVLVQNSAIKAIIDRKEMIDCVSRCSIGASQTNSLIKLQIEGMNMKLSAEDIDFSLKSKEEMMVSSNGDITIGFKYKFLLNILNTIQTDEVLIEMNDCSRAAMFREYKDGEIVSNKTCLLMPMLLND